MQATAVRPSVRPSATSRPKLANATRHQLTMRQQSNMSSRKCHPSRQPKQGAKHAWLQRQDTELQHTLDRCQNEPYDVCLSGQSYCLNQQSNCVQLRAQLSNNPHPAGMFDKANLALATFLYHLLDGANAAGLDSASASGRRGAGLDLYLAAHSNCSTRLQATQARDR